MRIFLASVSAIALSVAAQTATAAVFTYNLSDNDTAKFTRNGAGYRYGLRLDSFVGADQLFSPSDMETASTDDSEGPGNDPIEFYDDDRMIFSFELGGASAQLTYDDVAGTAKIERTMVRSLAGGGSGLTWNVIYEMSGVENVGTGMFIDRVGNGSGSISNGDLSFSLGAKARGDEFFLLTDTSGREDASGLWVGEGWVNYFEDNKVNDFLFNASLATDPTQIGLDPVPLPAAGWLMLDGLGGLAGMKRRKDRS